MSQVFIIALETDWKPHKAFTLTEIRYLTASQIYSLQMLNLNWCA